jgi:hypothetical protein
MAWLLSDRSVLATLGPAQLFLYCVLSKMGTGCARYTSGASGILNAIPSVCSEAPELKSGRHAAHQLSLRVGVGQGKP